VIAFIVPAFALIALVLIGRRATPAAPAAAPAVSAVGDAGDASPVDAVPIEAAPDAGPRPAVEQLGDGGFVVDLNLATEEDLRKLPGVGPARAKRILELRARLGKFKSVDDLARIKGFGRATLKRLRPLTRVGT
jgi:competence protein ComEA